MAEDVRPAITPQQKKFTDAKKSSLNLYRALAVGDTSLAHFLYYELCLLFLSNLPGLLGFGARSICYQRLFERCGRRPAFGRSVLVRNPKRISLGEKVIVDDHVVLDARRDSRITLGDYVSVSRYSSMIAKEGGGEIVLHEGVNLGSYCRVATQSRLEIGASTLVAGYCYIGPGNHLPAEGDLSLIEREMEDKGGVRIGSHVWIGTRSTIVDGVTIGDNAIVGAHSLVREDVPANAVVVGAPARIIRMQE